MAKLRRFVMESLESAVVGTDLLLPAEESRHVHVLRLKHDTEIEVNDTAGRLARAVIVDDSAEGIRVRVVAMELISLRNDKPKLILGVAWPKGKRAAVLVEKCAELGVDRIVPTAFERGVVSKDEESEGLVRLRRIAAEASKQSRRDDVMSIDAEMDLRDFLTHVSNAGTTFVLDPYAEMHLVTAVINRGINNATISLLIGPEGGLTDAELALAKQFGAVKVRMAAHVLRIETAAMAAAAICRAVLER